MKKCSTCKILKSFDNFSKQSYICKNCNQTYQKNRYVNNPIPYKEARSNRLKQLTLFVNWLKSAPCMDCGISYPSCVMDFDHRDPKTKVNIINNFLKSCSKTKLFVEIQKCDLVCSNCHRLRTHKLFHKHK